MSKYVVISNNVIYMRYMSKGKKKYKLIKNNDNQKVNLNESSDLILQYCDGSRSLKEITYEISNKCNKNFQDVKILIEDIINNLLCDGFVEILNKPLEMKERRKIPEIYRYNFSLMSLFLEITNKCNLKCSHCYVPDDEFKELKYKDIINIIERASEMGLVNLEITGGEALLHDNIFDIINYTVNKPLVVSLLTNGMIVNEDVVNKLKQIGLNNIRISLDGHCSEIHDEYRNKKGSFNKAVNAIELFYQNGFNVEISTVINKLNINYIEEIINFCRNNWNKIPNIAPQLPQGRALTIGKKYQVTLIEHNNKIIKSLNSINKTDSNIFLNKEKKIEKSSYRCSAGIQHLAILSNGNIKPCCDFDVILGNIKKDNIRTIWENHLFLTKLRNQNINSINICNSCKYKQVCQKGCMIRAKEVWGDYNWPDIKECIYYNLLDKNYSEKKVNSVEDKIQMKVLN